VNNAIKLKWLSPNIKAEQGVTWGVPWKEGVLQREENITLFDSSKTPIPVQSWPTAFWPDGSVKWTAHAAAFINNVSDCYYLSKGNPVKPKFELRVSERKEWIEINTGKMVCRINKRGKSIIQSVFYGNAIFCTGGKLICIREERKGIPGSMKYREETFESRITNAVVEQKGPVRVVVKVDGVHKSVPGEREWLPFSLRLYFYTGMDSFKVIHTFIYDGDKHKDFIKGLGMQFDIPMSGPFYNRHIRFVGDTGVFSEALQLLLTWRPRIPHEIYKRQIEGHPLKLNLKEHESIVNILDSIPSWDSYKLVQDSADHYCIKKRTKEECCWINAGHGKRAGGLAYAGGENGGLAIGLRNIWEKYPASIEFNHLTKDEANMKIWFWSPDCPPMDFRHYDTQTYVSTYYEGFHELRSTPYGIANTSEIVVCCFDSTPSRDMLISMAEKIQSPGLLICEPEYYHEVKAFGTWSLIDRGTEKKSWIEDQLNAAIEFYKNEIEQRKWYGFWDYGDFMHTYDAVRHTWRYDMGGYAWQNTELVPTLWLWYAYLRSGRPDIFRMAEAMSRHTSEVDIYHIGEYAGLGSRHNVIHWGCGCKEARISMAGHHRFYYYLTGDERMGDILREVKDADYATKNLDPMRAYYPKDQYPTHTRSGPDWAAFCSNWLAMWERFEDTSYRDKILRGIECLKKMPYKLHGASVFGYDPDTGNLYHLGSEAGSGSHLVICMGGPQIWMEISGLIKDREWDAMLAEYGEFYNLPAEEKQKRTNGAVSGMGFAFPVFSAALLSYAAVYKNDEKLAKKVWEILIGDGSLKKPVFEMNDMDIDSAEYIRHIREIPWVSTNTVAQWCLNTIIALELVGNYI